MLGALKPQDEIGLSVKVASEILRAERYATWGHPSRFYLKSKSRRPMIPRGWGVYLVEELAKCWGVERRGDERACGLSCRQALIRKDREAHPR